ncbi:MAG: helix-turn-helix domain-containing protein [Deltaproteobacteria bacterium]|nr:helix-turn-helix domain-containing protein [Deltaproteobacteria bacterium]
MDKLLLKTDEAAKFLSIGRTLLYRLSQEGQIGPRPIKLGDCTLWSYDELKRWVESGCPGRTEWIKKNSN